MGFFPPLSLQVRETETWVPLKNKSPHEDLESSGDSPQQDFEFDLNPTDDVDSYDDDDDDDEDEDQDDYDEMSGSGFSEIQTEVARNFLFLFFFFQSN